MDRHRRAVLQVVEPPGRPPGTRTATGSGLRRRRRHARCAHLGAGRARDGRAPRPGLTGHEVIASQVALLRPSRSEEHTSELQSLMRISYAVFCLKKKKTN